MNDRRLIEEWLPIAELSEECTRERRSMTALPPVYYLHVWWARRPLVASRAAVLGSLLPEDADRKKFLHLLGIHGDPVAARAKIDRARRTGVRIGNPYGYERAFRYSPSGAECQEISAAIGSSLKELLVLDQVAGGGSIPFESIRLGASSVANDLNPVAVLIMKATVEWPLVGRVEEEFTRLAANWRRNLEDRLLALFPQEDAPDRMDATYLWAHTVRCPYCHGLVPLSPNWRLAPDGTGVRLRPRLGDGLGSDDRICGFEIVRTAAEQSAGTVTAGAGSCPYSDCGRVIDGGEIKQQTQDGEMGHQLYAIAYKKRVPRILKSGKRGKDRWVRGYRAPRASDDNSAEIAKMLKDKLPEWLALDMVPSERVPDGNKTTEPQRYGMPLWRDMFSPRQLLCHGTSVEVFREMLDADRRAGELTEVRKAAYGYLALAMDKMVNYDNRGCRWDNTTGTIRSMFDRHDFAFVWSYGEMAPCVTGLGYDWVIRSIREAIVDLERLLSTQGPDDNGPIFGDDRDSSRSPPPPPPPPPPEKAPSHL